MLSKLHHMPIESFLYVFIYMYICLFNIGDYIPISTGKVCTSCGKLTSKYVEFKCPKCGEETIIRCMHCRETYTKYKCPKCGFEGP
ncbi:MAG: zinc finger domain-containing protein [Candidatus Micrarchaeia archaeon]